MLQITTTRCIFLSSIFCGLSTFRLTNNFVASYLSAFLYLTLPLIIILQSVRNNRRMVIATLVCINFFFIMTSGTDLFFGYSVVRWQLELLLTKYSMIFFCISVLFLLLKLNQFSWLQIIIATSITLLIFSPNVIWNITHDFPTLKHHVEMTSLDKGTEIQIGPLIEFLIGQFIIFSPIIFLVFFCFTNKKLAFFPY